MTGIIAFLLKIGFGGIIDKAIDLLKARQAGQTDREKLKTQVQIAAITAAVEEARIMEGYNRAKLDFPWFWCFAALFLVPLGIWWAGVLLDSTFKFGWGVADLPQVWIRDAAVKMIDWVFFTGSVAGVAGAARAVLK